MGPPVQIKFSNIFFSYLVQLRKKGQVEQKDVERSEWIQETSMRQEEDKR